MLRGATGPSAPSSSPRTTSSSNTRRPWSQRHAPSSAPLELDQLMALVVFQEDTKEYSTPFITPRMIERFKEVIPPCPLLT